MFKVRRRRRRLHNEDRVPDVWSRWHGMKRMCRIQDPVFAINEKALLSLVEKFLNPSHSRNDVKSHMSTSLEYGALSWAETSRSIIIPYLLASPAEPPRDLGKPHGMRTLVVSSSTLFPKRATIKGESACYRFVHDRWRVLTFDF